MVTLEKNVSLSKSMLWNVQKNYFKKQGVDAWDRAVPFYATSNIVIARKYARLIFYFIREGLENKVINKNEPVYIVEPCAGSGKLAFHLVMHLVEMLEQFQLGELDVCYVLTDIASSNVSFWQQQPQLKDLLAKNVIDFAEFDVLEDASIKLLNRKEEIEKNKLKNPLIITANYAFDVLPCDLFHFEGGEIFSGKITSTTEADNVIDNQCVSLNKVETQFDFEKVEDLWDELDPLDTDEKELLSEFCKFGDVTNVLYPVGAIACINKLASFSNDKFFMIAADKGYSRLEQLRDLDIPKISIHGKEPGCFSMMVNFPFIAEYLNKTEGAALFPSSQQGLKIVLLSRQLNLNNFPQTTYYYNDSMSQFCSQEYLVLKNVVIAHASRQGPNDLLATLRLSQWDPYVLSSLVDSIIVKLPEVSSLFVAELEEGIFHMLNNYYFIPSETKHLYDIGRLLHETGNFELAVQCYLKHIELFEESWEVLFNLAVSFCCMHDYTSAKEMLFKAKQLNSNNRLIEQYYEKLLSFSA